jgi:hypothetical protein
MAGVWTGYTRQGGLRSTAKLHDALNWDFGRGISLRMTGGLLALLADVYLVAASGQLMSYGEPGDASAQHRYGFAGRRGPRRQGVVQYGIPR